LPAGSADNSGHETSTDAVGTVISLPEAPPAQLTLRNGLATVTPDEIARRMMNTFHCPKPLVEPAEGQAPGNFSLAFRGTHDEAFQSSEGLVHIASLGTAAVINMVALRDVRNRVQLLAEGDRGPQAVQMSGELHLVPSFEWRLLRVPQLTVRPAPKMTPLARVGPVPGLGPPLPASGPGIEGHRIAVGMELEATRLRKREGKQFRSGRAVRSWLVTWLPNLDAVDISLLLAFWSKDMVLHEDLASPTTDTAYKSVTVGPSLTIQFPDTSPLPASALQELTNIHCAVLYAHRTGSVAEDKLPCLSRLRAWGVAHLSSARIVAEQPLPAQPSGARYRHRDGFGAVRLKQAPVRDLGLLNPGPTVSGTMPETSMEVHGRDSAGNFCRVPNGPTVSRGTPWAKHWRAAAAVVAARNAFQQPTHKHSVLAVPPFSLECVMEAPSKSCLQDNFQPLGHS